MVQRKQPGKLSTPIETKKRSTTNKPLVSSSQNQDIRNKGGTDLKKKLKKSRSLRLLDFENIESSSPMKDKEKLKNCIRSPAVDLLETPTKSSSSPAATKVSETSPNYMKSTSSSNARKERTPVSSSRSSQTVFDSKNQKRENSNNSQSSSLFPSPSGEKTARSLTKKNSLKPVRTLTKTSSIKAGKPKKSSTIVLNQNSNMSRATCSSTLKDSKFPNYLMLNPGRSESERTLVMKVCPYTYCSLNGHHHAPSPPLKCFLSAKRRLLRTQRSLRLKSLSPGGTKLPAKAKKGTVSGQGEFEGDSSTIKTDTIQETGKDFFVEIYAKPRETVDTRSNHHGEEERINGTMTEFEAQNEFLKSIRDGAEAEVNLECCCIETNKSGNMDLEESELDESVVQTSSEMNLEEGEVVTQLVTDEVDSPNLTNEDMLQETSQENIEGSDAETADFESYEAYLILELDVCQDQLVTDEVDSPNLTNEDMLQETSQENIEGSDAETADFESYEAYLILELDVCQDQLSFAEDTAKEQTHEDKETHLDHFVGGTISNSSVDKPYEELPAASGENNTENNFFQEDFQLGDHEAPYGAEVMDVNLNEEEENDCFGDDALINHGLSSQNTDLNAEIGQEPAPSAPYLDQLLPTADFEVGDEEEGSIDQDSGETHKRRIAKNNREIEVFQSESLQRDDKCVIDDEHPQRDDKCVIDDEHPLPLIDQPSIIGIADNEENKELTDKDQGEETDPTSAGSKHPDEHNNLKNYNLNCIKTGMVENMQVQEQKVETYATETVPCKSNSKDSVGQKSTMNARKKFHPEVPEISCNNLKITIGCRKNFEESEELNDFNPRDPNYLPVEPEPEAETVDLKQHMMDERRNAEEWMVDFALRKAVTELAPARKRRVALLIEAFETVTPQPKRESLMQHVMPAFAHARPMQACI